MAVRFLSWLVVVGCIGAAALVGSARLVDSARTAEQRRLATEAGLVAAYLGKDLAGLRDVTGAWAQRRELVAAMDGARDGRLEGARAAEGARLMASLRLARGSTGSAFIVDAQGRTLALAPFQKEILGQAFSDREWFRGAVATGRPYVSGAYRSVVAGNPWVIAAGAPVYAPRAEGASPGDGAAGRGRLLGVVGSFVPLASLQEFTASYHETNGSDVALVSANGAVLTGPLSAGTVPARVDGRQGSPGVQAVPDADGLPLGRFGSDRGSVDRSVFTLSGRDVLAARADVTDLPYRVVAHRDEDVALAGAAALARSLQLAAAALVLVLTAGVVVWRRTVGARRTAYEQEQRRLAALHRASPSGILELDIDLVVTGCNDALLRLLGLERAAVVGAHKERLFHPDSPPAEPGALADLVAHRRSTFTGNRLLRHADGHAVPVQLDWGIVADEHDDRSSLVCIVTDVAAQHALQTELERARERAEVLWRQAPIGVIEGTPDGVVLGTNQAFADLLGYGPDELVGTEASALVAPELQHEIDSDVERLKSGSSYAKERCYLAKDGRRVPVFTSATMLHTPDGKVERLVGFVVDLTPVHAHRRALTNALEDLAKQKAFTDALLETVDVGIVYVDADGSGMTRNRAGREMSFLPPGHDGGRPQDAAPLIDLLDADGHVVPPDQYPLVRVLRGEDPPPLEGRLGAKGGPLRDVVMRASRITGARGDLLGAVVAFSDVTVERTALRELKQHSTALAEAQRLGRLGSFSLDPTTGTWSLSDQLYELWGHPVDRPGVGQLGEQVLSPSLEELEAGLRRALITGGRVRWDLLVRHAATGEQRHIVSTTEVVLGPDGSPCSVTGTHQDVTELSEAERAAQEARAFFEAALVASPDYTSVLDLATGAVLYGTPGKDLLGRSSEQLEALGADANADLVHPDDLPRLQALDIEVAELDDGQVASLQLRCRHADGSWRWVHRRVTPFRRDDGGVVVQVLSVARDVTDLVEAEQRLAHTALHDTLTGLPNRRLLADRLDEGLARSLDTGRDLAVLYVDLDGFKRVNDGFGHAVGDEVLKETSARLRSVLRPQDTVARVGGDEFVVLVEATDRATLAHATPGETESTFAEEVAARLVEVLGEPIEVEEALHTVTASIGIRCVPAGSKAAADAPEQVLADADTAMYVAKAHGKDGFALFAATLRSTLEQRSRVERSLRGALRVPTGQGGPCLPAPRAAGDAAAARLYPVFQPVFDHADRLVSFEALCRLEDEHGLPLSPEIFIPVAEETGLVRRLGAVMLEAACAQLTRWRAGNGADLAGVTMAVNVSAVEAQEAGFADRVRATLSRHGLRGSDVILELTETSLLSADSSTLRGLQALRAAGVGIAIDDFGTGYASLRYLVTLPVSAVKVDKSFTAGLPHDMSSTRVVLAVAALAADLGLDCVIEGVENAEQRAALPGTAHLQGYLLGRPQPGGVLDINVLVRTARQSS